MTGAAPLQHETPRDDDGFLALILQRYSHILAVRCRTRERLMEFTFLAEGRVGAGEGMRLRTLLEQALDTLARWGGRCYGSLRLRRTFFHGYTQLTVQRDLDTLSVQEIGVMVGLMRQVLGPRLVAEEAAAEVLGWEPGARTLERDGGVRLAHLLQALKRRRGGRTLIGLRHSGQVLVYRDLSGALASTHPRPR